MTVLMLSAGFQHRCWFRESGTRAFEKRQKTLVNPRHASDHSNQFRTSSSTEAATRRAEQRSVVIRQLLRQPSELRVALRLSCQDLEDLEDRKTLYI